MTHTKVKGTVNLSTLENIVINSRIINHYLSMWSNQQGNTVTKRSKDSKPRVKTRSFNDLFLTVFRMLILFK